MKSVKQGPLDDVISQSSSQNNFKVIYRDQTTIENLHFQPFAFLLNPIL